MFYMNKESHFLCIAHIDELLGYHRKQHMLAISNVQSLLYWPTFSRNYNIQIALNSIYIFTEKKDRIKFIT